MFLRWHTYYLFCQMLRTQSRISGQGGYFFRGGIDGPSIVIDTLCQKIRKKVVSQNNFESVFVCRLQQMLTRPTSKNKQKKTKITQSSSCFI